MRQGIKANVHHAHQVIFASHFSFRWPVQVASFRKVASEIAQNVQRAFTRMQQHLHVPSAQQDFTVRVNAIPNPASHWHARSASFLKPEQMLALRAEVGRIQDRVQLHVLLAHLASFVGQFRNPNYVLEERSALAIVRHATSAPKDLSLVKRASLLAYRVLLVHFAKVQDRSNLSRVPQAGSRGEDSRTARRVRLAHTQAAMHQAVCRVLLARNVVMLQQCQHSVQQELLQIWVRPFAPRVLLDTSRTWGQVFAVRALLECDVQVVHNQTRVCLEPSQPEIHLFVQRVQQGSTQTGADQTTVFHAPLATLVWIQPGLCRVILDNILSGLPQAARHAQLESIHSIRDILHAYHAQLVGSA